MGEKAVGQMGGGWRRRWAPMVALGGALALLAGCTTTGANAPVTVTDDVVVTDSGGPATPSTDDSASVTTPLGSVATATPTTTSSAAPKPVVTASPVFGSSNLSPSDPIVIKVARGTLGELTLTNPSGKQVKGTLSADRTSWQLGEVLGYGKTYTVKGSAIAADGASTPITGTFSTLPASVMAGSNITPGDGAVVGIAQPVIIRFPVAARAQINKAEIEKRLSITTEPKVEGSWGWVMHDEGWGVDWRPKDYWPAGTKVKVTAKLYGVKIAAGKYGAEDLTTSFTIGRAQVTYADVRSFKIVVKQGCTRSNDPGSCDKTIASYPASFGSARNPNSVTRSGIHVVNDKFEKKVMTGTPPANYRVTERWAVRISNNGEFIHENPSTVDVQGNANVSNGCVNLSPTDAPKYYASTLIGDPVEVIGSSIKLSEADGDIFDWTLSWGTWQSLSALN